MHSGCSCRLTKGSSGSPTPPIGRPASRRGVEAAIPVDRDVLVQHRYVLERCSRDSEVRAMPVADVDVRPDDRDVWMNPPDQIHGPVARGIIHDNDVRGLAPGLHQRPQTSLDERSPIVGDDNDCTPNGCRRVHESRCIGRLRSSDRYDHCRCPWRSHQAVAAHRGRSREGRAAGARRAFPSHRPQQARW